MTDDDDDGDDGDHHHFLSVFFLYYYFFLGAGKSLRTDPISRRSAKELRVLY